MSHIAKRIGRASGTVPAIVFLCTLTVALGCKLPSHPSAIDPADISQPDARAALRSQLPDLEFIPEADSNLNLKYLIRSRLYGLTQAVLAVYDSTHNPGDSSRQLLRSYRWSGANKKYDLAEEWSLDHIHSIQLRDLTGDSLDELIISTTHGSKKGLAIWGRGEQDKIVTRYRSDSVRPVIIEHLGQFALLVYDSLHLSGYAAYIPGVARKYFGLRGGAFVEVPTDPAWLNLFTGIRDSLQQFYALKRESILNGIPLDRTSFVRSLIGLALFDSSWESTRGFLQRQVVRLRPKLASSMIALLSRIGEMNRTYGFVHIGSPNSDPELIILLSRFDDAIAANEQTEALKLMQAAARRTPRLEPILAITRVALIQDSPILLYGVKSMLDQREQTGRINAEELRLHGRVEQKLYNEDFARTLFLRSLQLDSTSRAADEIRRELYEN